MEKPEPPHLKKRRIGRRSDTPGPPEDRGKADRALIAGGRTVRQFINRNRLALAAAGIAGIAIYSCVGYSVDGCQSYLAERGRREQEKERQQSGINKSEILIPVEFLLTKGKVNFARPEGRGFVHKP